MTDPEVRSAQDLVSEDLSTGLTDFEVSSFEVDDELSPEAGVEAVAWEATLRQVHEFRGKPAGREPIPLRGVTFVRRGEDGTPLFRRYIDWFDLFNRLGLSGAMRPVTVLPGDHEAAGDG